MTAVAFPLVEQPALPAHVLDYLDRVLPEGPAPGRVRLAQEGTLLRKFEGSPYPFHASQEIAVDEVAFAWEASVRYAPILPRLHVSDRLQDGVGSFRATILGVPVAQAAGPELSAGQAMRYLAELPWAPHAMLNPRLRWHVVDEHLVEVEAEVGGATASVGLRFDERGDVIAAFGSRPRHEGEGMTVRPWVGLYSGYENVGGLRIPTVAEAHWTLPDGPLTYFHGTITAVELG